MLFDHDGKRIAGRARLANRGTSLDIVEGIVSEATAAGREVAALMREGHPWELSVGISGAYESCDRRRPTTLNGRSMALDLVMRRARLLEVSFVVAGADPNTSASRI